MKLSFSTLGCPEWDWSEIIATARDLGYDGVEIRGVGRELYAPDVPQFQENALPKTLETLARTKLAIPCLTSDNVLHRAVYKERSTKELTGYMRLAKALGVPYIRVLADDPQPWPGVPVHVPFVKDFAQELAEKAAEYGVTLLIETNGWFADTEKLARLLDAIGRPNVAALWDVHHPYRYRSESAEVTWQNIGKYVKHVHLKDSTLTNIVKYQMMGHGDLPLESFFGVMRDGGYDGFYSLEWTRRWDLTLEMPGIVFAQYISYMRGL